MTCAAPQAPGVFQMSRIRKPRTRGPERNYILSTAQSALALTSLTSTAKPGPNSTLTLSVTSKNFFHQPSIRDLAHTVVKLSYTCLKARAMKWKCPWERFGALPFCSVSFPQGTQFKRASRQPHKKSLADRPRAARQVRVACLSLHPHTKPAHRGAWPEMSEREGVIREESAR